MPHEHTCRPAIHAPISLPHVLCIPSSTLPSQSSSTLLHVSFPGPINPTHWGECDGGIDPVVESCNGLDDDCDGSVDEVLLRTCGSDIGACLAGLQVCAWGQWGECIGQVTGGNETCNGIDDDCDGIVDNRDPACDCDSGETQSCGPDVGQCTSGTQLCTNGGWGVCNESVGPHFEVCDAIDNDCDGFVDEDILRPCGTDMGECVSGFETCGFGDWGQCSGVGPTPEICDGLDNDCNGLVDDDESCVACTPGEVRTCGTTVGACSTGNQTCVEGVWGECQGAVAPKVESCNSIDDDCDGSVDEGIIRSCGTDVGVCSSGLQTCSWGVWSECNGATYGEEGETCNGIDDDCDGIIDNRDPPCSCEDGTTQACGTDVGECVSGTQTCSENIWGECNTGHVEPVSEACDGLDNNCDGFVDENLVRSCGSDVGACVSGYEVCSVGNWAGCTDIGPSPEVCDGLDNDCNGIIDDAPECNCTEGDMQQCGLSLGECDFGMQECTGGVWGECVDSVDPIVETCNGLDDDCDGSIDEGLFQLCGSDVGICSSGLRVCAWGVWTDCQGFNNPFEDEICNGLDDDCDGIIDNSDPGCTCENGDVQSCGTSTGTCDSGVQVCIDEQWSMCAGGVGPTPELCDGLDNNCDGFIDEDVIRSCGTDIGECVSGFESCSNGAWGSCSGQGPLPEVCDGLDNDCNGLIDDNITCVQCTNGDTMTCGRDVGECTSGVQTCVDNAWGPCVGSIAPIEELCNGLDDDCDGITDEYVVQECGSQVGYCVAGTQVCNEGAWDTCSGTYVGPKAEECNGIDDDCDGIIDNALDNCTCTIGQQRLCGTNIGACMAGVTICTLDASNIIINQTITIII